LLPKDTNTSNGRRYAILTEYDGTPFSGWQIQDNAPSVQQCLQDAWHKLTGETVTLTGGSRTDAGVSASHHVSSFQSRTSIPVERIALAWNSVLPDAIAVHDTREVRSAFNPRYDALGKTYRYTIVTGSVRPVLARHFAAFVPGTLGVNAMRQACLLLAGTHDFTSFMDQGSPTTRPVRTLHELGVAEEDDRLVFTFMGDGFLYHMVRILAGTLVSVGQGKIDPKEIETIFESRDRTLAGPTMPPEGLLLERVFFADHLFGDDRWAYQDPRRADKIAHLRP
jgi:tRNA pseudouridine38-40 synthase